MAVSVEGYLCVDKRPQFFGQTHAHGVLDIDPVEPRCPRNEEAVAQFVLLVDQDFGIVNCEWLTMVDVHMESQYRRLCAGNGEHGVAASILVDTPHTLIAWRHYTMVGLAQRVYRLAHGADCQLAVCIAFQREFQLLFRVLHGDNLSSCCFSSGRLLQLSSVSAVWRLDAALHISSMAPRLSACFCITRTILFALF